jgi:fucose permease
VIAAGICGVLILGAIIVRYPEPRRTSDEPIDLRRTLRMMSDPYAFGFSTLIMLYVAVEVAIYVWMPTYLRSYDGRFTWLSTYALSIFFVLRAAGRFVGAWLLNHFAWTAILGLFALAIFACFAGSLLFGTTAGVFLLPLSGLFMSMMYPTLNSKGISCFPKSAHGTVAGVILFFTATAAALGPLAMAIVSDAYGDAKYGFALATVFAALLLLGLLYNWMVDPTRSRLQQLDAMEYGEGRS